MSASHDDIARSSRLRKAAPAALLLAVTIVGAVLIVSPGLRRDYSLEAFVAGDSDDLDRLRAFAAEFGSNELALIAVRSDDALHADSRAIVAKLVAATREIREVERATSLADIPPPIFAMMGERLRTHPLIEGNLLSRDGTTAAIVLHMADAPGQARRQAVAALRAIVEAARRDHPTIEFHLAGPYVTLIDMYEYVDRDLLVFSAASLTLMGLTLWLVFRRFGATAYSVGASLATVMATLGAAAALDLNCSLIVQMIAILLFVLTGATGVQLVVRGEEEARHDATGDAGLTAARTAAITLRRLAWPCVGVVLTTSTAFASVAVSNIASVRTFGLLMAAGLIAGLGLTFAALPLALRFNRTDAIPGDGRLSARLAKVGAWSLRRRGGLFVMFTIVGAAAIAGLPRLRFESDFVQNFRAESPVRQAYEFIEHHLTPLGSIELVIRTRDGRSISTPAAIAKAASLTERIVHEHRAIRKAMSPADMLTVMQPGLPDSEAELNLRLALARQLFGPDGLRAFINDEGTAMRLNLRAVEGVAVGDKLQMCSDIEEAARAVFGPKFTVEVTGLYYFYARLVHGLVRDQYTSFAITVPLVFLIIVAVLRSIRLALAALAVNLVPVLVCVGTMAWLAIPVNMTTVMMLSVTFGIAVDHTIHYLWRCREEFRRCGRYEEAIVATHGTVGRACLFTTVVVAGGFWILLLSRFLPTAYFGGLIGFTMMWALLAGLLLLPAIVVRWRLFGAEPAGGAIDAA
jgi:predicted RND superfamily exporter protein